MHNWSIVSQVLERGNEEDELENVSQYYPFNVELERDRAGFDQ